MNFALTAALRVVRFAGYRAFPPPVPPPVNSVWVPGPPRKGKRKRRLSHAAMLPRAVFEATATHVTYGHGDTQATITLGSWHRWRQAARATLQVPA